MTKFLPQIPCVSEGCIDLVALDLSGWLDSAEVFTGTPTIVEVGTSDLTLSNKAVSTTTLTILGATVAAGKAIQFLMQGQQAGTLYQIKVTAVTDSTPSRTYNETARIQVV